MRARIVTVTAVLMFAVTGCTHGAPVARAPVAADLLFVDGDVVTMDGVRPQATAVAVRGGSIVGVGSDADLAGFRGPGTRVVDLGGATMVPGFVDAHEYRVQKHADVGADVDTVLSAAVAQGWTTVDEMYADPSVLATLHDLDAAGRLPVRVDAYLPVMQYDAAGTSLGDWYRAYHQGQLVSPHVRVAGLIAYTDYDNAHVLLWSQPDLNAFLLGAAHDGWSVALKTVSTRSLAMILTAYQYVQKQLPAAAGQRDRLEHVLFATVAQIGQIKQLGLVPVINLNNPGQLVGDQGVDDLIAREPTGAYTPWRAMVAAGLPVANGTGWPSYYAAEPAGAPFGSPVHLLYQAVTRTGNLGTQPYPWLLDQTVTVEQALHAMTIGGAYAAGEEATRGSITPGKLADLVVLSADPRRVPATRLNNIQVRMTMIGGRIAWCAAGCPESGPPSAPTATGQPADPFVGDWIATDPTDGSAMTLHVTRTGSGYTVMLADDRAAICGGSTAAEINASGTATGGVLSTQVTALTCQSSPPHTLDRHPTIRYTFDPATATLTDDAQHATWHRG